MKEHEPDTARRHASLLLQILSYAFTENTRGSLDTLDLLVHRYEPRTRTPRAEPRDACQSTQYVCIGLRRRP